MTIASDPVSIPHLSFPLSFSATAGMVVDEQDSLSEILSCVRVIVECPIGGQPSDPTFGIPDLTFQNAPVNAGGVQRSIVSLEPRAATAVTETGDPILDAHRIVGVTVSPLQVSS
jgi:hypothetical protein